MYWSGSDHAFIAEVSRTPRLCSRRTDLAGSDLKCRSHHSGMDRNGEEIGPSHSGTERQTDLRLMLLGQKRRNSLMKPPMQPSLHFFLSREAWRAGLRCSSTPSYLRYGCDGRRVALRCCCPDTARAGFFGLQIFIVAKPLPSPPNVISPGEKRSPDSRKSFSCLSQTCLQFVRLSLSRCVPQLPR